MGPFDASASPVDGKPVPAGVFAAGVVSLVALGRFVSKVTGGEGQAAVGGGFGGDAFFEVVGDELGIGGAEIDTADIVVIEVDLLEEGLVHEPSCPV